MVVEGVGVGEERYKWVGISASFPAYYLALLTILSKEVMFIGGFGPVIESSNQITLNKETVNGCNLWFVWLRN